MSGGSFDYLCYGEVSELLDWSHMNQLERMADALTEAHVDDAAKETEELLAIILAFKRRMDVRIDRLAPVWKAMEWVKSGDWGKEEFDDAVLRYRGEA